MKRQRATSKTKSAATNWNTLNLCLLQAAYIPKIEMIQRLAWPPHEDDMQIREIHWIYKNQWGQNEVSKNTKLEISGAPSLYPERINTHPSFPVWTILYSGINQTTGIDELFLIEGFQVTNVKGTELENHPFATWTT